MKKITLFLVAGALATFTSCDPDKNNTTTNPTPTTPTYFVKAKINGTMYEGTAVSANKMNGNLGVGSMITYNGHQMAFGVNADSYSGVKTYQDTLKVAITLGDGLGTAYSNVIGRSIGTVKITEDNGTDVKGEFSGKLHEQSDTTKTLDVTEGSFHVKWIQ